MARKGLSLREQKELQDDVDRLRNFRKNAGKRAAANKDEGKQAIATVIGGAGAGWLDAQQEILLSKGEENRYELVKDVPTEGLISFALTAYGVFGKKTSKFRKYALSGGSGGLAYTVGAMIKKKTLEGAS